MFYTYHQNNSGGHWDIDEKAGIGRVVIVEADSPDDADKRAEEIGLYFDGAGDCECCGNRWCNTYDDGDPVPTYYNEPVWASNLFDRKVPVFIHAANGEITKIINKD